MSTINQEPKPRDPAFPHILDDAAPRATAASEPVEPAIPGEDYLGASSYGVTAEEALEGESLQTKLERELPEELDEVQPKSSAASEETELAYDPDRDGADNHRSEVDKAEVADQMPGRLIDPDEGAHPDLESEAIATDFRIGEDDLSPEEAAMHVE